MKELLKLIVDYIILICVIFWCFVWALILRIWEKLKELLIGKREEESNFV